MCSFYAQDPHAVLRYDDKGTRYTVAYFRTLRDYSEDLREKLNSHGFGLLPAVKRQEICHICEEDTKDSRDRILLCDGSHGQCTAEVHLKCLEPGRSPDDATKPGRSPDEAWTRPGRSSDKVRKKNEACTQHENPDEARR